MGKLYNQFDNPLLGQRVSRTDSPLEPKQDNSPKEINFSQQNIASGSESDTWVLWIQDRLNYIYQDQYIAEDGKYGQETYSLIKRFQREHGLSVDGRVGPETYNQILIEYTKKTNETLRYKTDNALLTNDEKQSEVQLAAALCQYVYNHDPLRRLEEQYSIGNWNVVTKDNITTGFKGFNFNNDRGDGKYGLIQRIQMNGFFGGLLAGKSKNMLSDLTRRLKFGPDGYIRRGRTGFGMMLFYKLGNNDTISEIACVLEGSINMLDLFNVLKPKNMLEASKDWLLVNGMQGLFNLSPQHTLAVQISRVLKDFCDRKDIKLKFYGHSLGGGLAASCALAANSQAITFDMAGLHFGRRLFYGYSWPTKNGNAKKNNITNYYIKGEFLSCNFIWGPFNLIHNGIQKELELEDKKTGKDPYFVLNPIKAFDKHGLSKICNLLGCLRV